jgi:hypothetical protein
LKFAAKIRVWVLKNSNKKIQIPASLKSLFFTEFFDLFQVNNIYLVFGAINRFFIGDQVIDVEEGNSDTVISVITTTFKHSAKPGEHLNL